MRNYTNTEKTATFRNLYTGQEITLGFPTDERVLDYAYRTMTGNGEHDYLLVDSCNFYGFLSNFHDVFDIYDVEEVAERLECLEYDDADKLEAMAEVMDNLDDIERVWDESYFIYDTTLAAWAALEAEERGDIPTSLPEYIKINIDWDSIAADMELSQEYYEINGGVLRVAQ